MAILRPDEVRKLAPAERQKRGLELKLELAKERAKAAVGASAGSPGRLREIRRTLARIETIAGEEARSARARASPLPEAAAPGPAGAALTGKKAIKAPAPRQARGQAKP